jgi:hypothetical protein
MHLLDKHVLKALQYRNNGAVIEGAEQLHYALDIDSPQLVERDESRATLETAPGPPGIGAPAGCHRCHDDGPQVLVQFVRGHDNAVSRLLDFAA